MQERTSGAWWVSSRWKSQRSKSGEGTGTQRRVWRKCGYVLEVILFFVLIIMLLMSWGAILFLVIAFVVLVTVTVLQGITLVWVKRTEKRVKSVEENGTLSRIIGLFTAIVDEKMKRPHTDEETCAYPAPKKTTSKTIRERLKELPDGYRELAMKYESEDFDKMRDSMEWAIFWFVKRSNTKEGPIFWIGVYNHFERGWDRFPLPPLPKQEKKPRKPVAKKSGPMKPVKRPSKK